MADRSDENFATPIRLIATHTALSLRRFTLKLALVLAAASATTLVARAGDTQFQAESKAAMNTMMERMDVSPTGDIDKDFVAMMAPHHQGAIDMAQALLRHSRNDQLKRLAQEIIVTQQQEIAVMQLAIGAPLPPSVASPTQPAPAAMSTQPTTATEHHHHHPMQPAMTPAMSPSPIPR